MLLYYKYTRFLLSIVNKIKFYHGLEKQIMLKELALLRSSNKTSSSIFIQVAIQKEFIKEERKKHLQRKESLRNVETKKTSVGGLKDKLQKRKSRKSIAAPLMENQLEGRMLEDQPEARILDESEADNGSGAKFDDDEFR